jgi:metacaspase-1
MAEGIALHLGVDRIDPSHYAGFDGGLASCEHDAADLETIARAQGYSTSTLLAEAATTAAVGEAARDAAASLGDGDIFLLTFSGFGGEVPDQNTDQRSRERTWALHDRQLPEDELVSLLTSFRPNVRLLIIDDSSASGTVRRDVPSSLDLTSDEHVPRMRGIPSHVASEIYRRHSDVYDEIQRSCTTADEAAIAAAVMIMSGCTLNQVAMERGRNGVFTEALLQVWDNGGFTGDYRQFETDVADRMPPWQSPLLTQRGSGTPYVRQRPFSI